MSNYVLVRHKVRDYSSWKPMYDAHLPKRVEAGLTQKYLLRGAEDRDEIVLFFEAEDLSRAMAFVESADLRETMEKAGVVDVPDVYFLTD